LKRITAIRVFRTIAIAAIFLLLFCSRFIDLFMATEEGRGYLEMVLRESLRAFIIALVGISQNYLLMITCLQFGMFSLVGGFVVDIVLNWLIKEGRL